LFNALIRGEPSHTGAQNFVTKKRDLGAAHSGDFVILAYTVLTQYSSLSDRWMPRPWLICVKHSAVMHKN